MSSPQTPKREGLLIPWTSLSDAPSRPLCSKPSNPCYTPVYDASAWYGFSTAADTDRLEAVIRRGIRSGLCSIDQLSVTELIDDADDSLFSHLMDSENHVLHQLYSLCDVTLAMTCDLDIMIVDIHINLMIL